MTWLSTLTQVLATGGVATFLTALVSAWFNRRKSSVEADQLLSVAAMDMLKPAREQIEYLRTDLAAALKESHELREQVGILTRELEDTRRDLSETRRELDTLRNQMQTAVDGDPDGLGKSNT